MKDSKEEKGGGKAQMRRIVLDMKGGLLSEAVMQSLSGCDPDFLIYRSSKPEETLALCRTLPCQCVGDGGHPTGNLEAE